MSKITRPPVRWHGAKFLMSRQILPYFPAHRAYTEAFGGGAGVLLHKPRSYAEIYNDLDDSIVTLFRTLQDPVTEAQWLNPACADALDRKSSGERQLEMIGAAL